MSSRRRLATALTALALTGGLSAAVGCQPKKPAAATEEQLPPDVFAAMNRADETINEGEAMVEQGKKQGGAEGDKLVAAGTAKVEEGKKMKAEAAARVK
ncbi:MAG TPA: hypothetical protein VF796_19030 [Humisphaera sp.]